MNVQDKLEALPLMLSGSRFESLLSFENKIQFFADGEPPAAPPFVPPATPPAGELTPPATPPAFGMGEFTSFLEANKDAQTIIDARVQERLQEQKGELEQQLRQQLESEYADGKQKTPAEIEIAKLREEMQRSQREVQIERNRSGLLAQVNTLGVELSDDETAAITSFCLAEDAQQTNEKFGALTNLLKSMTAKQVEKEVAERLRGMSHNPGAGGANPSGKSGVALLAEQRNKEAAEAAKIPSLFG